MVTPDFDGLAPHYRWLEAVTFGPLLHRCRTALLPHLGACRRALVLGDGNGRFLADLLRTNPDLTADALDLSPAMNALTRRRVGDTDRVRFRTGDARTTDFPHAGYDLIVANFFLDCFTGPELRRLVPRLADALEPGGRWAVGDFRLPDRGWRRLAGRVALAGMYAFFRLVTRLPAGRLIDPDPLLRGCGLAPERIDDRLGGFLSARLWLKPVGRT